MKTMGEKSPGDTSLVEGKFPLFEHCREHSHQPSCEELTSKGSALFLPRLDQWTASTEYLIYQGFDFKSKVLTSYFSINTNYGKHRCPEQTNLPAEMGKTLSSVKKPNQTKSLQSKPNQTTKIQQSQETKSQTHGAVLKEPNCRNTKPESS